MAIIDVITEWEKEHNLFEKGHIDGFAFYSYLRRELVNTAVNSKNNTKTDPFAAKGMKDDGIKLFKKLLKRGLKTKVKNPDMLILCHPRRQKEGDVYESVFTDFLEEEFENTLTLERLFDDHSHYEPCKTKNICYVDRVTLKSYIVRILASKFKKKEYENIKKRVRDIVEAPFLELEEKEGIDLKKKTYYDRAVMLYYFYKVRKKAYAKFLDKVRPKMVAEVVSKSVDAMLINELAKDRGIPVVELQHSLLGPIAVYPDGIYEKQSPDYYLSYSDYWSEYQKYPIAPENVTACGSAYFERQVKKYKTEKASQDNAKKSVLFISGPTYGEELSKLAIELKNASKGDVEIIYKLHPDEFNTWKELYPALLENDINVIDSRDVSIYEFFNEADAQVGVFSTALYEGMAFDISTYILDNPFAGEFRDLCDKGYAVLVADGKSFYESLMSDTGSDNAGSISEKFWKADARNNITAALRKILNETKA